MVDYNYIQTILTSFYPQFSERIDEYLEDSQSVSNVSEMRSDFDYAGFKDPDWSDALALLEKMTFGDDLTPAKLPASPNMTESLRKYLSPEVDIRLSGNPFAKSPPVELQNIPIPIHSKPSQNLRLAKLVDTFVKIARLT